MHSRIRPNEFVALRLPSGALRIEEIIPNTYVWYSVSTSLALLVDLTLTHVQTEGLSWANMDRLMRTISWTDHST